MSAPPARKRCVYPYPSGEPLKSARAFQLVLAAWLLLPCCGHLVFAQETIVAIRHAEKPPEGLGQLECKGLNRALALPKVLIPRFGKPAAIFAPNPGIEVNEGGGHKYSYVRPLVTIEPTAIQLGLPVNAEIGYRNISALKAAVTAPEYQHDLVFIAWEHGMLNQFAKEMLTSYGLNPDEVPPWPESDFDRIYIFRIQRVGEQPKLTFKVERQGLTKKLANTCPTG